MTVSLLLLAVASLCQADAGSPSVPIADLEKTVLYGDTFERGSFHEGNDAAGAWRPTEKQEKNGNTIRLNDGVLSVEHPRDVHHPLGLFWTLSEGKSVTDVAVFARFRFAKADHAVTLGFTGEKEAKAHNRILMFSATPAGFRILDATGKGSHESREVKVDLPLNTWHTVWLVNRGTACAVHVNKAEPVVLDSKGFGSRKTTLKLGTGTGFELDDLNMWSLGSQKEAPDPVSITVEKTLYETDFAKVSLKEAPWQVSHGSWKIEEGSLVGTPKAEEHHQATVSLMIEVQEKMEVGVDFRLAKDETISVCFIGGPGPHSRVHVNCREMYLWMKAGDTGAACVADYAPITLSAGKRHHLSFFRSGDRIVGTVDGRVRVAGRHEKLTGPKKRIVLGCWGTGTRIDNVAVRTLSEVKAPDDLFAKPTLSQKEFWTMREEKYGLKRVKDADAPK